MLLALIVIVVPLLLNVKPVTVGKVPIVGVIDVTPLKAVTTVVVEVVPINAPSLFVENT